MAYRIDLTKSVDKELDRLSAKTHDKIIQHLVEPEQDPRKFGTEKLTGIHAYKLRAGNFRIDKIGSRLSRLGLQTSRT